MLYRKPDAYSVLSSLLRPRKERSHKGTYGTLTVIAGSANYRGAASLAVSAALRCGVGLVRLASTERVIASVSAKQDEPIYLPLAETETGSISAEDLRRHMPQLSSSGAILVGCGMTDCPDTAKIVATVLRRAEHTVILDADALNALSHDLSLLSEAKQPPILTPHIGEMARLTGLSVEEIQKNRETVAREFAQEHNVLLILKDSLTLVVSPSGEMRSYDFPNSGLAKGGSGDVLAGILGSLAAQGFYKITVASDLAVILHVLAAQEAAEHLSETAMLPSDVVSALPAVFSEVQRRNES
ncbi:MAG: NAD(P)H-hydrate dehydratase [Ruminococcaceae bacterium]|nr:NAD(P)H-hydrate dehydratase [Oscillospiraceae bacterium]